MKNKQAKIKVAVALSGGVDSAVAAALLKKQGYEVVGVFMQFWFPAGEIYGENRCCSLQAWQEAQEVASALGIKIYKVNFGRQFKRLVVDEFLRQYQNGLTPNPCVTCNKFIKFDLLWKYVQTVFGADYLATGHYVKRVKIKNQKSNIYALLRSKDKNKDQTYFLYNLKSAQLKYLLFPLGDYTKAEVRQLAKKFKLAVYAKPDSQEICFVGKSHYDFLKKYLRLKSGDIIDIKGRVWGQHKGLPLYTLGQRSGLRISGGPWYVAEIDHKKNLLVVTKKQKKSAIYQSQLVCQQINWLAGNQKLPLNCQAQIRYRSRAVKCLVTYSGKKYLVKFVTPIRAITRGQSVVFYDGDKLLGGGVID